MAITASQLSNRAITGGAVVRVIRTWPNGPARGTVSTNMPLARAKRLAAMGFVQILEPENETPKVEPPVVVKAKPRRK